MDVEDGTILDEQYGITSGLCIFLFLCLELVAAGVRVHMTFFVLIRPSLFWWLAELYENVKYE